jgi:hypothetical protein
MYVAAPGSPGILVPHRFWGSGWDRAGKACVGAQATKRLLTGVFSSAKTLPNDASAGRELRGQGSTA